MLTARRRRGPQADARDIPSSQPGHRAGGDGYRRQARRLRARFRGQPARIQQSLLALSRECDAARQPRPASIVTPALRAVFEVSPETARRFSRMVRDHLEGQILRFEPRQLLIRAAARMGIDRFQASLIIAAIQHAQALQHAEASHKGRGDRRESAGWAPALALFTLIQGAMAFALWRLFAV